MITIQELLFNRNLDKHARIKLVRHKHAKHDLYGLYRTDKLSFLDYQRTQGKDVFKDVDYIVSFIGEEGMLSRFVGVYKMVSRKSHYIGQKGVFGNYHFEYQMEEVFGFEDLKERVIIDWGANARAWHQWIDNNNKEVVQIHPGLHYTQFKDYFDFVLDFKELQEIADKQYGDWKKMLSVTKGIYLISDSYTGKQYVGAAYGEDGIWGRWTTYVSTKGHGGNQN